jgi:hypothetical protein
MNGGFVTSDREAARGARDGVPGRAFPVILAARTPAIRVSRGRMGLARRDRSGAGLATSAELSGTACDAGCVGALTRTGAGEQPDSAGPTAAP